MNELLDQDLEAKTLGGALAVEQRHAEPVRRGVSALASIASVAPLPFVLIRWFAWFWVIVSGILLLFSLSDGLAGKANAVSDALRAVGMGGLALGLALLCDRLILWLHTFADRGEGAPGLVRQGEVATHLLAHLSRHVGADHGCRYHRTLRSIHGWVDDGSYGDESFTWLSLSMPWEDQELVVTATLGFTLDARGVHLLETWSFRGPIGHDPEGLRRLLEDAYEVQTCHPREVVVRHGACRRQHFVRGTSSTTPWSVGEALDRERLVEVFSLVLPSSGPPG